MMVNGQEKTVYSYPEFISSASEQTLSVKSWRRSYSFLLTCTPTPTV